MEVYCWSQNRLYWLDAHDCRMRNIVQPYKIQIQSLYLVIVSVCVCVVGGGGGGVSKQTPNKRPILLQI